jgi:hypothetical protein
MSTTTDIERRLRDANPTPADLPKPEAAWSSTELLDQIDIQTRTAAAPGTTGAVHRPAHRQRGPLIAIGAAFAVVVVVGAVALASSTSTDSPPATTPTTQADSEEIYGVWITPGDKGLHFTFNEDGSWSVVHPDADPDRPAGFGTFTYDGELLIFTTDPNSRNCSPNAGTGIAADAVGIYEAAFTDEGDLVLNDVDDPCVQARVQTRGTLARYSP